MKYNKKKDKYPEMKKSAYNQFLESKSVKSTNNGIDIELSKIHPMLFDWQKLITQWALRKGRCAIFLDTGLGKTMIQLEWARLLGKNTLIIAPLSVAKQTIREAQKIDLDVRYVRHQEEALGMLSITNYEMADRFDFQKFDAVVLDEASILKSFGGKIKQKLISLCAHIPYRLCCTATPAPNDYIELGNHAEFLGICKQSEMLAMFFVNANREHLTASGYRRKGSNKGGTEWRLKHHAEAPFFKWLSSWAISMTMPSDLGFDDGDFILPPLNIFPKFSRNEYKPKTGFFITHLKGVTDRVTVRRDTLEQKLSILSELISSADDGQWVIWCGLDEEQRAVEKILGNECSSVYGSLDIEEKLRRLESWLDGSVKFLVSKPRICGFGLNLQQAHNMIFLGLNDSWEAYYQAIRRVWRYGQKHPVNVHLILHEVENEVYQNVLRKDGLAKKLKQSLIEQVRNYEKGELGMSSSSVNSKYEEHRKEGEGWTALQGDSCERLKEIETDSVALSIFSPPFADLFTYSSSERDLGNSKDWHQFFEHYAFIVKEMLRVTKSGRLSCVHTSDIPALAQKDGYIGVKDFPGAVISAHEKEGWIFTGRAFVQKNPQPLKNDTPVLTPSGWMPIESLKIGDKVIGSNGKATIVMDIPYRGIQPMYRVTTDDGASVDCGPGHLWTVQCRAGYPWKKRTVEELLTEGVKTSSGYYRYQIPIVQPVEFESIQELPIHPKLLGAWLADGNWSSKGSIEITKDKVLVEALPLPAEHSVVQRKNSERAEGRTAQYGIVCEEWHRNDIIDGLRKLGLQGCRAWEKFIPDMYLYSTIQNRRELLCGLLDGDGKIQPKKGGIWYRTTSPRLAEGVLSLVNSLGGLATSRLKMGNKYNGKQGRPIWEVSIRLNGNWNPFSLERKSQHWKNDRRGIHRTIISIEKLKEESPCTCISVDSEDGLFVTEGFVLTHNSQAIRTKAKGLLFVQMRKDSSDSRPALIDQILIFKKPGENAVPIEPVKNGEMDNETWIEWAHGIWLGIRETETLQYQHARGDDDEKHICPLQLGTIERCIKLYSNPGETILTPFGGIGSEAYMALKLNRKAILIELKPEYYKVAVKNLQSVQKVSKFQFTL